MAFQDTVDRRAGLFPESGEGVSQLGFITISRFPHGSHQRGEQPAFDGFDGRIAPQQQPGKSQAFREASRQGGRAGRIPRLAQRSGGFCGLLPGFPVGGGHGRDGALLQLGELCQGGGSRCEGGLHFCQHGLPRSAGGDQFGQSRSCSCDQSGELPLEGRKSTRFEEPGLVHAGGAGQQRQPGRDRIDG